MVARAAAMETVTVAIAKAVETTGTEEVVKLATGREVAEVGRVMKGTRMTVVAMAVVGLESGAAMMGTVVSGGERW